MNSRQGVQHVSNAVESPETSRGNTKHGVSAMEALRQAGKIDKRTTPFRAIKKAEQEIMAKHLESRKRWHVANVARLQYYCQRIDEHLLGLKRIIRKGRVNPAVDLRLRLGEATDRNYEQYEAILRSDRPLDLARRLQWEQLKSKKDKS